jgi:hypothetical protein
MAARRESGWKDHLLRAWARGQVRYRGRPVETRVAIAVLDRILADSSLEAQLQGRDERGVLEAFLALYAEEIARRS